MVAAQELVARATLKYLGTSAQKARLVVDLIRGQDVGEAAARLRHVNKAVARDIARLLDSAVANARQKQADVDVDQLFVRTAFVDGGPSLKRIRPAPMGRAFRVLRRMCHVTLGLGHHARPKPAPAPRERRAPAGTEAAGTAPAAPKKAARAREARPAHRAGGARAKKASGKTSRKGKKS